MPDAFSTFTGIVVVAAVTYAERLAGYLLGSRMRPDSTASRVLDALPGSALAAVLALSMMRHTNAPDLLALMLTAAVFIWTRRTLPALGIGLAVAVINAHYVG